ncbi:hypothetical protein D9599_30355 [Roseomonas sp. KE2513]|nr:hypothetical protein [Roseomonas sp. KE2513]
MRHAGGWRSRWCWKGPHARTQLGAAAWTVRRCATGCTGTTPRGVAGLVNRHAAGPAPRLSTEQEAVVAHWVEKGPELERDGVVRWRCRDLQERIGSEFRVSLHERTVGKLLTKLRFCRLSVRPQHPQSDPAAQAAFKGASRIG